MSHLLTVAAYLSAAAVVIAAVRRWAVRPIREAVADLRRLTAQLRNADALQGQLMQLAGAVTNLAAAQQGRNDDLDDRLASLVELVVEINADVARNTRALAELMSA